jgi:hypothetical protein
LVVVQDREGLRAPARKRTFEFVGIEEVRVEVGERAVGGRIIEGDRVPDSASSSCGERIGISAGVAGCSLFGSRGVATATV